MPTTTAIAPKIDRASRVEQARNLASLPRRPLPTLLLLCLVYRDRGDGGPSLGFRPGVDRADAVAALCRALDGAEPRDFGSVVGTWASAWGASWASRP